MSDKIDVNEIMNELEKKLRKGLSEKQLTVTDISMLVGEYLEKAKEKILEGTGEIINEELPQSVDDTCDNCGKPLKKTKK